MHKRYPRMFIGLDLAGKDKLTIEQWREKHMRGLPGNFVPVENFHITLSFLDQVQPDKMEQLHALLSDVKAETLTLTTTIIGYFQKPQVLHLGIENTAALDQLARQCASINNRLGLAQHHTSFRPHITLMRKHKEAIPFEAEPPKMTLQFNQFHLFESVSSNKKGMPVHYPKRLSFDLQPRLKANG